MGEVKYVAGVRIEAGTFVSLAGEPFAYEGEMIQLVVPGMVHEQRLIGYARRFLGTGETIRYDPERNTDDIVIRASFNFTSGQIDPEKRLPLPLPQPVYRAAVDSRPARDASTPRVRRPRLPG